VKTLTEIYRGKRRLWSKRGCGNGDLRREEGTLVLKGMALTGIYRGKRG
jgi:hypothetical protein